MSKVIEAVIRRIHATYDKAEEGPRGKYISADEAWRIIGGDASYLTISRAKKALGITSYKVSNQWYWSAPTTSPDAALRSLGKTPLPEIPLEVKQLPPGQSYGSTLTLKGIVESLGYDLRATEAIRDMQAQGYSKVSADRAKRILGLVSIRESDGYHWVYPAPEVQEWLAAFLGGRCIRVSLVYSSALDRGWSRPTVRVARLQYGGILDWHSPQGLCWYNMNKVSPPFARIW